MFTWVVLHSIALHPHTPRYLLKEVNCRLAAQGFKQRCQLSASRPELLDALLCFNDAVPAAPYALKPQTRMTDEQYAALQARRREVEAALEVKGPYDDL